jgi:transposase
MADFLDAKIKEIDERLKELGPLVEEHKRLEAARAALGGVGAAVTRRGPGRPRGSGSKKSTGTTRRGRRRGSGNRAAQTLELVRTRPGITIAELADTMGIKPNYLYRVLPGLEKEKKVKRAGKGWHPAS